MATHDASEQLLMLEEAYFDVLRLEEQLSIAKDTLRHLVERDVPDALEAAEMKGGVTPGGFNVRLGDEVHVNMPSVKERGEMIRWCVQNEYEHPKDKTTDLIKRVYSVEFGRSKYRQGEDFAARCAAVIRKDFPFTKLEMEETIHGSTLKSFVSKRLRAGIPLPDFFGYYAPRAAILEIPREESPTEEIDLMAGLKASLKGASPEEVRAAAAGRGTAK